MNQRSASRLRLAWSLSALAALAALAAILGGDQTARSGKIYALDSYQLGTDDLSRSPWILAVRLYNGTGRTVDAELAGWVVDPGLRLTYLGASGCRLPCVDGARVTAESLAEVRRSTAGQTGLHWVPGPAGGPHPDRDPGLQLEFQVALGDSTRDCLSLRQLNLVGREGRQYRARSLYGEEPLFTIYRPGSSCDPHSH